MAEEKKEKGKKEKVPTAKKRIIQSEKNRDRNRELKSKIRTAIRHLDNAVNSKESKAIEEALKQVYSLIDKAVKNGVWKINKGSRTKSRLVARSVAVAA